MHACLQLPPGACLVIRHLTIDDSIQEKVSWVVF